MGFYDYGNEALSFIMSENFVSESKYGLLWLRLWSSVFYKVREFRVRVKLWAFVITVMELCRYVREFRVRVQLWAFVIMVMELCLL